MLETANASKLLFLYTEPSNKLLKTVTKMFKSYNLRSYLRNMHIFYEYFLSTIIFYALAIIRNSRNCEAKRKRIDQTYKDS